MPRDQKLAEEWLEKATQSGDSEAKTTYALFLLQHKPSFDSIAHAKNLLTEAAEAGHAQAALQLGNFFSGKFGGPVDLAQSVRWFTQAANAGNVEAQYALALIYSDPKNAVSNV